MKHSTKSTFPSVLVVVLMTMLASGVLAGDKITFEDGQLTIENSENDSLFILNSDGMQEILSEVMEETMDGMHEVLTELDDMQLEVRLGDDNQLSFETEDQMWEMNLDVIFAELGNVLETAFEDMDTEEWTVHQDRRIHRDLEFSEEELAEELDQLKKELRKLQKELDSIKEL